MQIAFQLRVVAKIVTAAPLSTTLGSTPARNHFPANGPCNIISLPRIRNQSPSGKPNTGTVGLSATNSANR